MDKLPQYNELMATRHLGDNSRQEIGSTKHVEYCYIMGRVIAVMIVNVEVIVIVDLCSSLASLNLIGSPSAMMIE